MSDLIDTSVQDATKSKVEKKRQREISDIKKIVSMPEGRRFVWRVLSEAGIYKKSFTGTSETYYLEGRRSIGLFVLGDLMAAKPEVFAQMTTENFSEMKSLQKQQEDLNGRRD